MKMFREMKGLPDPDEEKKADEENKTDGSSTSADPSLDEQEKASDSVEMVSEEAFAESPDYTSPEADNNNTDIFAE